MKERSLRLKRVSVILKLLILQISNGKGNIRSGLETSLPKPFYINSNIWDNSAWRVMNFMFCERCGYPVPGKHGVCHSDLNGEYNGHIYPVNGGWHDAADMSQQSLANR